MFKCLLSVSFKPSMVWFFKPPSPGPLPSPPVSWIVVFAIYYIYIYSWGKSTLISLKNKTSDPPPPPPWLTPPPRRVVLYINIYIVEQNRHAHSWPRGESKERRRRKKKEKNLFFPMDHFNNTGNYLFKCLDKNWSFIFYQLKVFISDQSHTAYVPCIDLFTTNQMIPPQ